jgi:CheY-like chemotaxis protein
LVVEDDPILNEELMELLAMFFKDVFSAKNGLEGFEKFQELQPDIILSDITMPKMNGVELSSNIRKIDKEQPIVILSGHRELHFLNQLIEIGVTNFIPKPYELQELLYKLVDVSSQLNIRKKLAQAQIEATNGFGDLGDLFSEEELDEIAGYDHISRPHLKTNLHNDDTVFDVGSTESNIEELKELNEYFGACVHFYVNDLSQDALHDISSILNNLYNILSKLAMCSKICDAIHSLAIFLEELDFDKLSEKQKTKLKILSFFYSDVSRFINTVFIFKENVDIEYLENSLIQSIVHIKENISSS